MSDHWNIFEEANERPSSDGTGWLMPGYCHAYRLVPQQLKLPLHYTPDNSIRILSVQARIVAWDNRSLKTNTHKIQPYSTFCALLEQHPQKLVSWKITGWFCFPLFFFSVIFFNFSSEMGGSVFCKIAWKSRGFTQVWDF